MSVAHKLPVEYNEADNDTRAPVVTLIGSDLPSAYLDEAEPSPLMERMSRFWRRIVRAFKLLVVLCLVGGYPVAMMASHNIDASPVILSQVAPWNSAGVGVATNLMGRELTGPGWAADRPFWHPQARLTALPAWQEGLTEALSSYTLHAANQAASEDGTPDTDLLAASRLLAPASNAEGIPRLNAAAEALQSYEGRLERGLAIQPSGQDILLSNLELYTSWATDARLRLKESADKAEGWPASRADIEAIYMTRAYAHTAAQLINASLSAQPELVISRDAAEARDKVLFAWERAANFNPVFVTSQAGTSRLLADHPATMIYYLSEVETAMADFNRALTTQVPVSMAVAEASTQ